MARPGEELIDPIRGQRLVFRRTAKETDGALVEVEAFYQPASVAPPAHLHSQQEERFEGLGASGLTYTHAGAEVSSGTMLAAAFSVLTHPNRPDVEQPMPLPR
jgi:hypothetical protein